jgi:glycosyltransferase involved in cell wall biosynthesis
MENIKENTDKKNKNCNLYIIGCHNFPRPSAASTRLVTYGKCLLNTSITPYLFCLHANYQSDGNNVPNYKGIYSNIRYEYAPGTIYRGKTFLKRRISEVIGLYNTSVRLISDPGKKVVMLNVCNIYQEMIFVFLCKLFNIPIIRESSEHLEVENKRPLGVFIIGRIIHFIYFSITLRGVDGFIVISRYLESFMIKNYKKAKLLKIPILIDSDFPEFKSNNKSHRVITYVGSLLDEKDGISILLEIFKEVSKKFDDVELKLIGGDEINLKRFKQYAADLGISQKVIFTGTIIRQQVFENLYNSDVLILTRPNNKQADAGFPTKLGEYLITGKPVVITDTGEIKYYLEDEVSAFIADPDNFDSMINKLTKVLKNDELAKVVGENGKNVALKYFSTDVNKAKLEEFILSFINAK